MSIEKSYSITLKLSVSDTGSFESIRLLKGRSQLSEDVLVRINKALSDSLIPSQPVKTTVAIGDAAEIKVMNQLLKISAMNMDFDVLDTSHLTGHGDMAVMHHGKKICVEVKCYTKPVPIKEIEKYYKSLALAEYDAGIMINLEPCGFAREANVRSPVDIKIDNGKPSAYLTATDLNIIYPIINMLIMHLSVDANKTEDELESKRKALISIHGRIVELRSCVESQKKTTTKMETAIESIANLSSM